jgi:hypothetical protein
LNANQALATNVAPHQFEIKPAELVTGSTRAAHPCVGIASKDKAVLFRQIGIVVAQIEVEGLVGERRGEAGKLVAGLG